MFTGGTIWILTHAKWPSPACNFCSQRGPALTGSRVRRAQGSLLGASFVAEVSGLTGLLGTKLSRPAHWETREKRFVNDVVVAQNLRAIGLHTQVSVFVSICLGVMLGSHFCEQQAWLLWQPPSPLAPGSPTQIPGTTAARGTRTRSTPSRAGGAGARRSARRPRLAGAGAAGKLRRKLRSPRRRARGAAIWAAIFFGRIFRPQSFALQSMGG